MKTSNVLTFSIARQTISYLNDPLTIQADNTVLSLSASSKSSHLTFHRASRSSPWSLSSTHSPPKRAHGPIIQILSSKGPLVLIVSNSAEGDDPDMSVAKRIAHDAWVYARLDAVILRAEEVQAMRESGQAGLDGSWVVIGLNNEIGREFKQTPS